MALRRRRNRDTQTLHTITRSMQTYREAGTQMARNDLHVSTEGECVKEVGPYFTAAGLLAHKRTQAIIIQVGVGWNARKGPSFFRAEGAYPYVNIWVYIYTYLIVCA
jgi:hypothetical protein